MVRPAADRLASRALAWLEEAVREGTPPWGYFLRPGAKAAAEGTRPEKSPVLNGSMVPLELVLKAFGTSRDRKHRKAYGRFFFMDQRENLDKVKS